MNAIKSSLYNILRVPMPPCAFANVPILLDYTHRANIYCFPLKGQYSVAVWNKRCIFSPTLPKAPVF